MLLVDWVLGCTDGCCVHGAGVARVLVVLGSNMKSSSGRLKGGLDMEVTLSGGGDWSAAYAMRARVR